MVIKSVTAAQRRDSSAPLTYKRQPIADRHERQIDPLIVMNVIIEGAQRDRVRIIAAWIGDVAIPQGIVYGNEPAGAHELNEHFVVIKVARFVRIDEGEI